MQAIQMSLAMLIVAFSASALAQNQGRVLVNEPAILSQFDRIEPENRMVADRLENLLPGLMEETGIELWLIINREYAEDPVYFTLVPQPSFAARRTTMLLFHRQADGTVDRLSVNRYPLGEPYQVGWSGGNLDEQWAALGDILAERDPETIGVNMSSTWPEADGLTHGLHQKLVAVLPEGFEERVVSAEELAVRWMETRSEPEQAVYPHVVSIARRAIAEGFSNRTITPGVTTTDDVAWALRDYFESRGLRIWFMPYVNIQRPGVECEADTPFCGISGVIQPGDVLHTDVGICYLKLCTDTQEMAYVMRAGEYEVPEFLQDALAEGNRWQDLLTAEFVTGRTGNEILASAQDAMSGEPWSFNVYTHPIGFVGHGPGATIGMWDLPGAVPNTGDWPVYANTGFSIEGNIAVPLERWDGQHVQIKLEQTSIFDGEKVIYAAGRQTAWHVVR